MRHHFAFPKAAALRVLVPTMIALGLVAAPASAAPAPIKVGGLFTEGASVGFPTTGSKTLKAFFKEYNARGGFKGRKVQVVTGNDSFNVEKNFALTKQMVDDGVMAFVGSEAFVNCLANAGLYAQNNLYTIGYGSQAACYGLKQFGAVTASTPAQEALSAQWAKQNIGGKLCFIGYSVPGSAGLYKRADQILAKLGTKFAYKNEGLSTTSDPTAALLEARKAGCRATVTQLGPGQNIQLINAKAAQRINNMRLVMLNAHDYKTLKATGSKANGNYAFSFLYPFSENDSKTRAYRRFCNKYNITPDSFSEPVYASAELFVKALESIKGSVTKESIGRAISKLNVKYPLMPGGRFDFGANANAPSVGGYMVAIKNGKFVKAPKSELLLPRSVRSLAGR